MVQRVESFRPQIQMQPLVNLDVVRDKRIEGVDRTSASGIAADHCAVHNRAICRCPGVAAIGRAGRVVVR